jgi:hypothetical protein
LLFLSVGARDLDFVSGAAMDPLSLCFRCLAPHLPSCHLRFKSYPY